MGFIHPRNLCQKEISQIQQTMGRMFSRRSTKGEDESEDSSSEDEYVLISALTSNITHGSDDWLIDSGASKHMTGFKES